MEVRFYETIDDELLKFAVIISRHSGKWVFCKHKERNSYEIPGGHREEGENIIDTAKRELIEETGALKFEISPVCVYSVTGRNKINQNGEEIFGMLYFAEIDSFSEKIESEIECIKLFDAFPNEWTYPQIQPLLIKEYMDRISND